MNSKNLLDRTDKKLIKLLLEDGRMSVKKLAEHLGLTSPTVQSRMKNLIQSGILKVSGLVDTFKLDQITIVLVAICVEDDGELDLKLEQIASLPHVHCAYAVTGRYDIFVEVILTEGMQSLYEFMTTLLPGLGGIRDSESFVVMKTRKKWTMLPGNSNWWSE